MENETDVIRDQMLETRTSLTEKLEALEEKVVSTVQGTTESVQEAVQAVTESVQDTVTNVSESVQDTVESVKSTFDIRQHVEAHPWAMFGGAVAIGFLGGRLMPSLGSVAQAASTAAGTVGAAVGASSPSSSAYPMGSNFAPSNAPSSPAQSSATSADQGSGLLGKLGDNLAPVAQQLQGMAIGTLAGLVGDMVIRSTPDQFRPQLADWINQLTHALGGVPVQGLVESWTQPNGSSSATSPSTRHPTI